MMPSRNVSCFYEQELDKTRDDVNQKGGSEERKRDKVKKQERRPHTELKIHEAPVRVEEFSDTSMQREQQKSVDITADEGD